MSPISPKGRAYGPPGLREQLNGVWGTWHRTPNGGVRFRPDGWRPKVHAVGSAIYPNGPCETTLCGRGGDKKTVTAELETVTCGSCINHLRIRRFRLLMILVATLIWRKTQPQGEPLNDRT